MLNRLLDYETSRLTKYWGTLSPYCGGDDKQREKHSWKSYIRKLSTFFLSIGPTSRASKQNKQRTSYYLFIFIQTLKILLRETLLGSSDFVRNLAPHLAPNRPSRPPSPISPPSPPPSESNITTSSASRLHGAI